MNRRCCRDSRFRAPYPSYFHTKNSDISRILAQVFPPSRTRSLGFATFSAGAAIGAAFGMVVGGTLTQFTA